MQIGQEIEKLLTIELDRFSVIAGWFRGRSAGALVSAQEFDETLNLRWLEA